MVSSEIRKKARESLKGHWGGAALIAFVYGVFAYIVSKLISSLGDAGVLLDILYIVINVPLSFGLIISYMKVARIEEVSPFDFFKDGFSNFKRAWTITGNILLKLIVYLVIAVVGIIIAVSTMAFGITDLVLSGNLSSSAFTATGIGFLIYLVALIAMIPKSFLYVLAFYIAYDNPEMSSKEVVAKSAELMMGNRWKYFCLSLSFIGWAILSAFTFFIGYFWLLPYMSVSLVVFYENLAGRTNSNPIEVKSESTNDSSSNDSSTDDPIQSN